MSNMVNLETFAGGALAEKLNAELANVIENIYDPNTDAGKTRKLTATITFKPSKNRQTAAVSVQVKSALAHIVTAETNIIIDRDVRTGKVMAAEIGNQMPGQVALGEDQEEDNQSQALKKQEGIINLKTAKAKTN